MDSSTSTYLLLQPGLDPTQASHLSSFLLPNSTTHNVLFLRIHTLKDLPAQLRDYLFHARDVKLSSAPHAERVLSFHIPGADLPPSLEEVFSVQLGRIHESMRQYRQLQRIGLQGTCKIADSDCGCLAKRADTGAHHRHLGLTVSSHVAFRQTLRIDLQVRC